MYNCTDRNGICNIAIAGANSLPLQVPCLLRIPRPEPCSSMYVFERQFLTDNSDSSQPTRLTKRKGYLLYHISPFPTTGSSSHTF